MEGVTRIRYSLLQEPRGRTYRALLRFSQQICDTALVVVREPGSASPEAQSVLGKLEPFLLDSREESQWPGTRLIGHSASIFRYRFTDACCGVMCNVVNGLYEWLQPGCPEDLCTIRDGQPWLTTVSHERIGYLDLAVGELEAIQNAVPDLAVHAGDFMPRSKELYRLFGGYLDDYFLGKGISVDAALAKYVRETSAGQLEEVVAAIRGAVFALKSEAVLRVVVERLGAGHALLGNDAAASVLVNVADRIEALMHQS